MCQIRLGMLILMRGGNATGSIEICVIRRHHNICIAVDVDVDVVVDAAVAAVIIYLAVIKRERRTGSTIWSCTQHRRRGHFRITCFQSCRLRS